VVLLGTRVWGTYGNIFSAPLVGFRNCCCGQKEYQCGEGIWFFVIPICSDYLEGKKQNERNIGSGYLKIFRIKRITGLRYFTKKNKITESLKNRSGKCKGPVGGDRRVKEPEWEMQRTGRGLDRLKNRSGKCEGSGQGGGTNGCLKRKVF
jgi:hypothetical protein